MKYKIRHFYKWILIQFNRYIHTFLPRYWMHERVWTSANYIKFVCLSLFLHGQNILKWLQFVNIRGNNKSVLWKWAHQILSGILSSTDPKAKYSKAYNDKTIRNILRWFISRSRKYGILWKRLGLFCQIIDSSWQGSIRETFWLAKMIDEYSLRAVLYLIKLQTASSLSAWRQSIELQTVVYPSGLAKIHKTDKGR